MSRLVSSLALVVVLAGCNPESGPFTLVNFHPPVSSGAATCTSPTATSPLWGSGTLDVGLDPTFVGGAYFVGIELQEFLGVGAGNNGSLQVGGTELETTNRDVPVIDEMVVDYKVTLAAGGSLGRLPTFHYPLNLKFDTQSTTGEIFGVVNLLSDQSFTGQPGAVETLRGGAVVVGNPVDLRALVQFRGHMSRSNAAVSSAVDQAPIRVFATDPASCTKARKIVPDCPFPGQDADPIACCEDAPAGTISGCN